MRVVSVVLALAMAALMGAAQAADEAQSTKRAVIPNADAMTSVEREAYRARTLVGDPARGAKLHTACFGCHGIERYTAPITRASATFMDSLLRASGLSDMPPQPSRFKGRITSLQGLRQAVLGRNDYLDPKMTPQEVADVVAYLNATYYGFTEK